MIDLWRYAKADRARMTRLWVIILSGLISIGMIITAAVIASG